jgi:hypothetical protein
MVTWQDTGGPCDASQCMIVFDFSREVKADERKELVVVHDR